MLTLLIIRIKLIIYFFLIENIIIYTNIKYHKIFILKINLINYIINWKYCSIIIFEILSKNILYFNHEKHKNVKF